MSVGGTCRRVGGWGTLQAVHSELWARAPVTPGPVSTWPARQFTTASLNWDTVLSGENRRRCITRLEKTSASRKFTHDPHKFAAVLVPMCHIHGELSILLTVRCRNLNTHRGEVSFPGGMADPGDRDLIDTALREAEEEIGIVRSNVDVWGMTPPIPSRLGGTSVRGVLAYIGHIDPSALKLCEDEVESVFAVSLRNLCNQQNARQTQFRSQKIKKGYTLPVYIGSEPRIWGLTAIITHVTLMSLLPGLYKHKLVHLPPFTD